jgi:hypothetical protein
MASHKDGSAVNTELLQPSMERISLKRMFPTLFSYFWFAVVCALIPMTLVSLQLSKDHKFSQLDEFEHFSYVESVRSGQLPNLGQPVGQSVMRDVACFGISLPGYTPPPCNSRSFRAPDFPGAGLAYESAQPPVYYLLTALLSSIPIGILHVSHFHADRSIGIAWLIAGLTVLWLTLRLVDLEPWKVSISVGLLASSMVAIHTASIVSNDSASIFCGSLVLGVGVLSIKYPGRWVPWACGPLAFFVTSVKATDVAPILTLAAFLFLCRRFDSGSFRKLFLPWLKCGGTLLLGSIAALGIWWIHLRMTTSPRIQHLICTYTQPKPGAPITQLFYDPLTTWQPFSATTSYGLGAYSLPFSEILIAITTLLLVTAATSGLFALRFEPEQILGLLSLAVLYVMGLMLGLLSWGNCGVPIGGEGRYALPMVPFLILTMSCLIKKKMIWAFIGCLAGGSFLLQISILSH